MQAAIVKYFKKSEIRERATQSILLYGSYIAAMALSFVGSMYTTRYLNPDEYGNFKFIWTLWSLLDVLISFGFFHSAGQALLHTKDLEDSRKIIGADLIVASGMGIVICLISILIAQPIDYLFHVKISKILIIIAPLLIFFPIKDALVLIFQCTNKIRLLTVLNIIPPSFFLLYLIILPQFSKPDLINITYGQQVGLIFISIIMVLVLKPSLKNLKEGLRTIKPFQKTYGKPVFVAVLCSVATQYANRLGIVYWIDSASIGYYSLAAQLVDPLRLIPSSIATSSFRDFSTQKKISKKVLWASIFSIIGMLLVVFILFGKPLKLFYPQSYAVNIARIGYILSFSTITLGLGELFNRFLGAHGRGKDLQNSAILVGLINISGFLFFTRFWGLWGMIGSVILGNLAFFLLMWHFYKNLTQQKN